MIDPKEVADRLRYNTAKVRLEGGLCMNCPQCNTLYEIDFKPLEKGSMVCVKCGVKFLVKRGF